MENYIELLKAIREKIPVICSPANTKMLKEIFSEYKFVVYGLPEKFASIKRYCEGNSYKIRTIIDDANSTGHSWSKKKLLFEEARDVLHRQIDVIISKSAEV